MNSALTDCRSVVELLQYLIQTPSVNPDGDPGTDQIGESAMADAVGEWLDDCGAESVIYENVEPERPNVIGRFYRRGGAKTKPRVLFAPHLDTVSVGGMTIPPFGGEVRDGRVWGRGACDTKGTMAAMLWAIREEQEAILAGEIGADIAFVGLMGEETGQPGSKHFGAHYGSEFDFGLVGEPTENHIVHCHKGCFWAQLTTTGKASHGASPHLGENAITKMMPIIQAVDTEFREILAGYTHPVLEKSTVNIGQIRGGVKTNIVPEKCTVSLDLRETPALVADGGARAVLRRFLDEKGWTEDYVTVSEAPKPVALDTSPDNPFVQKLLNATPGTKLVGAPWFCDAVWLAAGGIPSVAAGPGSIDQAHTKDEWISIKQLEAGVTFYRNFLRAL